MFDDAKIIKELDNWKPNPVFAEIENRVRNEHLTIGCAAKNVPIMESCQKAILASRRFQEFCDDIQKNVCQLVHMSLWDW